MKITIAQLNYIIGDFDGNTARIIHEIGEAAKRGNDLIVFSELCVCGYPPLDLLEHEYFIERCGESVRGIAEFCKGIAAIVGAPQLNRNSHGKNLFNTAFFLSDGKVYKAVHKTLLPTYDIFDEYRYFEPNTFFELVEYRGQKIALTICEDLWYEQPILTGFGKDTLYTVSPMQELSVLNPDFVINIAASPFSYTHVQVKKGILTSNAQKFRLPVVYINQTGANTDLIFDGASMVVNPQGEIVCRLTPFGEEIKDIDTSLFTTGGSPDLQESVPDIQNIHDALVLGIKDYFAKMNFTSAVIGLSGGIDSAVTLVLAEKALGKENLRVLLLPSKYSSSHSVEDAKILAESLGVRYDLISIRNIVEQFDEALKPAFGNLPYDLAEENIQARIRGNLLMAVSNKFGNILLNTSNKSESAVGYGTLYGDMSGGLSVLGDVYKTQVYQLAMFINKTRKIIPENIITKPPSAELRPDQKDSDSLPEYEILDKILYHYVEEKKSPDDIIGLGLDRETVLRVIKMVNINEFKRVQTPPILRVSSKAFGTGRRMPLVARYF